MLTPTVFGKRRIVVLVLLVLGGVEILRLLAELFGRDEARPRVRTPFGKSREFRRAGERSGFPFRPDAAPASRSARANDRSRIAPVPNLRTGASARRGCAARRGSAGRAPSVRKGWPARAGPDSISRRCGARTSVRGCRR